jgi:hypothetical protein
MVKRVKSPKYPSERFWPDPLPGEHPNVSDVPYIFNAFLAF